MNNLLKERMKECLIYAEQMYRENEMTYQEAIGFANGVKTLCKKLKMADDAVSYYFEFEHFCEKIGCITFEKEGTSE